MNYYNENDPHCCAWLANLIKAGLIPDGHIDSRSIEDVRPRDLDGFDQCHFFAGIGGWALALSLAGIEATQPLHTVSCPCQPFSAAGDGLAQADERHLWPVYFRIAQERRPVTIIGEQVDRAIGHGWLDGVFADLEGEDYACGAAVLGAHSAGAPHIRSRLYWVADSNAGRHDGRQGATVPGRPEARHQVETGGDDVRLAHGNGQRQSRGMQPDRQASESEQPTSRRSDAGGRCLTGRLEHASGNGRNERGTESNGGGAPGGRGIGGRVNGILPRLEGHAGHVDDGNQPGRIDTGEVRPTSTTGHWSDFDLAHCRDNATRRFERGSFPLAHGIPRSMGRGEPKLRRMAIRAARANRVCRLRGYGNAIVPQVAAEFIAAWIETKEPRQ